MNGRNDFVNGDPPSGRSDRYDGLYKRDNSSSGSVNNVYGSLRDRRAGGYGGFYDTATTPTPLQGGATDQQLTPKSSRLRIRDAEGGPLWSATRDDGRYGGSGRSASSRIGTGGQQIDGLLTVEHLSNSNFPPDVS
jgi:Xaa-Pro aminopeptidase